MVQIGDETSDPLPVISAWGAAGQCSGSFTLLNIHQRHSCDDKALISSNVC